VGDAVGDAVGAAVGSCDKSPHRDQVIFTLLVPHRSGLTIVAIAVGLAVGVAVGEPVSTVGPGVGVAVGYAVGNCKPTQGEVSQTDVAGVWLMP
jgi:hypothetical protein